MRDAGNEVDSLVPAYCALCMMRIHQQGKMQIDLFILSAFVFFVIDQKPGARENREELMKKLHQIELQNLVCLCILVTS